MQIGIDFDNTIITYDDVFLSKARELGLVVSDFQGGKQAIRDTIRLLPDGELAWQRLQGQVYGKGIVGAKMIEGLDSFLRRCRDENRSVVVVSHKTEFGHFDPDRVNLRKAALDWMTAHGFFRNDRYAIPAENIYFEGTRAEKIARIASLRISHFIDDLPEVLDDPEFPSGIKRILLSNEAVGETSSLYPAFTNWRQIEEHIFDERL